MDDICNFLSPLVPQTPLHLGIVVARYKESLDPWQPVAENTYIYSKGGIPEANDTVPHSSFRSYIELPNQGREGQTHLCHIVRNYDALDDIMIFSQADPFDLVAPYVNTTEQMVDKALDVPAYDVTPFNPDLWHDIADWNKINWTDPKEAIWITASQIASIQLATYTPGEFWQHILGSCHPPAIRAMHGGTFAVTRETIRSRPKEVYERALAAFAEANATNSEIGFFWERMWAPVFSKKYRLKMVEHL